MTRKKTTTKRRTRRPATPEQRKAARQRDAELRQLADAALADPRIGARVLELLNCSPRILGYSLRNQALLMEQAAAKGIELRDVDTFKGWKRRGRGVREGETGLRLVAYVGEDDGEDQAATDDPEAWDQRPDATEDDENAHPRFRTFAVFDISQTEGVETIHVAHEQDGKGAVELLMESLTKQAEKAGYRVHHCTEHEMSDVVEVDHADKRVCLAEETPGRELLAELAAAVAEILSRRAVTPRPRRARDADAQPLTLAVV